MVQANSFMNPFIYAFKVHSYIFTYNLYAFKHLEYIFICIFAYCDALGKGSKSKMEIFNGICHEGGEGVSSAINFFQFVA